MRIMGHLALALLVGVCTLSCRADDTRANAQVRDGRPEQPAEQPNVVIDSGKVQQDIEEGAENIRRSEPAQDIKEGAKQMGRGIAAGAGKAVEKTGEALEGAGKKIAPEDQQPPPPAPDAGH